MKAMKYYVWSLLLVFLTVGFVACSDDDDPDKEPTPTPTPEPEPEPEPSTTHFDIWVSVGENSGMGKDNAQLVKNMESLEAQEQIDFVNSGADVTALISQENIIKGKYYYQVPKSKDRIGKYRIAEDKLSVVAEHPFTGNTLKDRRYTHAWIDETTLVLMGSNGESSKILWIKLNAETMQVLAEGELDLPAPPKGDTFNTSGIANFRVADGKILYAYVYSKTKTHFYVAFINPADMSTEKVIEENRAQFMAGTAYGELLQSKSFFTPEGDFYLACNSQLPNAERTTEQVGRLLRIKAGETEFDKSYEGNKYDHGKLITVEYLTTNKALIYFQDPVHTGVAEGWNGKYINYYAILDLVTDELTELKYDSKPLPYSTGTFSQRSTVLKDKAYIGVNPENELPCVYIYDTKTGEVTKGLTISAGYEFDRIVVLDN